MNEIFSFRKKLNIKKIIIIALIIIFILVVIIFKYLSPKKNQVIINQKNENQDTTFFCKNKKLSLTFSNSYNFIQFEPKLNYILELRNENNLNVFVSEENLLPNIHLSELVESDLKLFVSQFENSSNISNISEFDRGGNLAYTYSLHYLDPNTKTAFYLQTIWIEFNNKYYIIDVEFPLTSLNENSKIINDILNSIVIK